MKHIVSRDNAHFRDVKKLCHSSRERRKAGRIVLDGMHLVESYIDTFGLPEEVLVSEAGMTRSEISRFLDGGVSGMALTVLADALFAELATVDTPSGIMAIVAFPRCKHGLNQEADAVLLDGIQDPGNLG